MKPLRLLLALFTTLGIWLCGWTSAVAQSMRVHLIDVGQGASSLIEFPCAAVLIDTGGESNNQFDSTKSLMDYLNTFFQGRTDLNNTLQLLVLSHPHVDHTRGVQAVLAKYSVLNAVTNGQETGSGKAGQIALHRKAQQANLGFAAIEREKIPQGGLTNAVIDPVKCADVDPKITALWGTTTQNPGWSTPDFNNLNNHSVAIRIDFGKASFLVAGDLENAGITDFVARYKNTDMLKVDVYQVGHHGSYNATTEDYIRALAPQIAVIAMGPPTRQLQWTAWAYGHPRKVAIDLLNQYVSGSRPPVDVKVATAVKTFTTMSISKAIYGTGWDGALVLEADVNGNWKRVGTGGGSAPTPVSTSPASSTGLININTASAQELMALPMIGPGRAKAIVSYRAAHGTFASIDDLRNVPGIGAAVMSAIRDRVTAN